MSSPTFVPSGGDSMSHPTVASANAGARRALPSGLRLLARVDHWLFAVAVSALIVVWQSDFNINTPAPHRGYTVEASTGQLPDLRLFFYFYYHYGLFPVGAREVPRLGPSRQDAQEFVAQHGSSLRMDFGDVCNTPRFGDYGKLFTLWPSVLMRGDPTRPSPMPFNQLLFVSALVAAWWAFWRERRVVLGLLVVLLMGSNPFQIYEAFNHQNIFSLPISVALLALAAHLPYLTGRRALDRRAWITALGSGVVLATFREIRTEAAIIALALPVTYLMVRASWQRRLALVLSFVVAWSATSQAWTGYWSRGFERSEAFVSQAGGVPFHGRHSYNHAVWHAVYCGLGDYGGDKGFAWDDRAAYRWATTPDPITNPRPLPYHYGGGYYLDETHDGVHRIAPTDLPEYNRMVRDRVMSVVRADPLWYARIVLRRIGAILGHATPAALTIGVAQLLVPGVGWLLIPILLLLIFRKRAFEVKLVLFTLPLSAAALLVYSGDGMTAYGIAHLLALAVALDLLIRAARASATEKETHGR